MIDSSALLTDLKAQLRVLQADLRSRADDSDTAWGAVLQREHAEALRRERTGLSWSVWRDNEVDQAAVAWVLATTFVRFCEDNDLLMGAVIDGVPVPVSWIAGPGDRVLRARENQTAYFRVNTSHHDRDWLQQSFRVLAAQPAGASLVDPRHNPVWTAEISAEAAKGLVDFWRRTSGDGVLVHDFTDPALDTRFLGDLYQDLSDHAKKTYALLQTPVFVEEFILDRTLTPAIAEFGVHGLKVIDPTCGSGHFLLGAFERLNRRWAAEAPGLDPKQRVRKAMDSIHGVDLNPFAVAIARFRLTVAGILAAGEKSLVGLEEWGFHLAIGDSLLGEQGVTTALFGEDPYTYSTEDLSEYTDILKPGRYHVVVGNPPYITVKDRALNEAYRRAYKTAHRQYQLTVPFMELFYRLAIRGGQGQPAGFVGQITGNGFMKREFGKKLIEEFFAGYHLDNPVDLIEVIDTSLSYIPGHGTPTIILIGRRRRPVRHTVRAVLSIKGEPTQPADAAKGLAWMDIESHIGQPGYEGAYVSVTDLDREALGSHPWSLSGGGAGRLFELISAGGKQLGRRISVAGRYLHTGSDEPYFAPPGTWRRTAVSLQHIKPLVEGDRVRDWSIAESTETLFPYDNTYAASLDDPAMAAHLWKYRSHLALRREPGGTHEEIGLTWFEFSRWHPERYAIPIGIAFASVSTHAHFSLDRGGKLFKQSAPVVKLHTGEGEDEYLELLGLLNSSTASFWLKQVSQAKTGAENSSGGGNRWSAEAWETFYDFTTTKLRELPVPRELPVARARTLDTLAEQFESASPRAVVERWVAKPDASLSSVLEDAGLEFAEVRSRMIFEQEELDWEVYRIYGITDSDLTYPGSDIRTISLGERAFEVLLAQQVADGRMETAWFERHGSTAVTEPPHQWPGDYLELVQERIAKISGDRSLRLVESPENKRRWSRDLWSEQVDAELRRAILARIDDPELWSDQQGPVARSVAQLADLLRNDVVLLELARALSRTAEPDLAAILGPLAAGESVPFLAAYRFKPSGVEKFRQWQAIWEAQRREDLGEAVMIPIMPKYGAPDYRRYEYWRARGKLDVPKERFVLYPGVGREGENSLVLGWAGWNHRDRVVALVREIMNQQSLGVSNEALVPMVAGLVELEPWLHQWHTELEPEFGSSAAQAVTSQIDQLLAQLQLTRADVNAWRPSTGARGRRRST